MSKFYTVGFRAPPIYDALGYLANTADMITTASEDGEPCVFGSLEAALEDITELLRDLKHHCIDSSLEWLPVPLESVTAWAIKHECGL